jgi:hypothetical protein
MLGFFLDWQNLMGGIRVLRKGSGPRPVLFWPLATYVLAAFVCDGAMPLKWAAIGAGFVFHFIAAFGVRFIGGLRAR